MDHPSASQSPPEEIDHSVRPLVFVAEDSQPDVFLIREALQLAGISPDSIRVAHDGEDAFRLFEALEADHAARCPDLVILDINLPRKKGADILRRIRSSPRCGSIKVLVVTSSYSDRDREEMARLGSNGYFRKPSDFASFMELGPLVRTLLGLDEPPGNSSVI